MYDFEATHDTTAKPEDVWAINTDVPAWVRWHGALEAISFAGPFASGSGGTATVQVGLSAGVEFRLEQVEPMKRFEVMWTVGPLLHTRMTHSIAAIPSGTRITHAYHTGGVMAPFNFLQAGVSRDRVHATMERIASLAEARPT